MMCGEFKGACALFWFCGEILFMVGLFHSAYRVLDANANRAFEGLRTLEELARFVLEDGAQTDQLKQLRHGLQVVVAQFDQRALLESRDASADVGAKLRGSGEYVRESYLSIAQAAAGRIQQSLRCLEEFSKLVQPDLGPQFERLRYAAYDLSAKLQGAFMDTEYGGILLGSKGREENKDKVSWEDANLYVLTDCARPAREFADFCRAIADEGCDVIQLRDKGADGHKQLQYLGLAVAAVAGTPTKIVANDRLDLAILGGADGVHVGQDDLPVSAIRRAVGGVIAIGLSTHTLAQVEAALATQVDYLGCGPTFRSRTKDFGALAGLDFLRQVSVATTLPAFAIGGIDVSNVDDVLGAGIRRIAVSHCVTQASDPGQVIRELKRRLDP